jgi:ubiquinol-cytochrome c reductase iron-sulfur subunit
VKRLIALLVWLWALLRGRRAGPPPPRPPAPDPRHVETGGPAWGAPLAAALLVLAGAALAAFGVLVVVDPDTQLLGATIAGGLFALAAAFVVLASFVAPRETHVEERPTLDDPEDRRETEQVLASAGEGVSRRKLLAGAAGVTGVGLVAAAGLPITALGPSPGDATTDTPWHRGRRLVDEQGIPIKADDIGPGSFMTAFPEGADKRELGSPVVVVQVDPSTLDLPKGREDWAPEGLMAYSKICTHASCAVSLFRHPLDERHSDGPALVCPCHYSTFDVRRGAKVIFGPAGRPLPQLPLLIAPNRELRAGGPFSGSIGPAWFRTEHPS